MLFHPRVLECVYLMLMGDFAIYVGVKSMRGNTGSSITLSRWLTVAVILSGIFAQLAAIVAIARLPMI